MEKRQENKLGIMPIPRLLMSMSLPLMVSMLIQSLYNIVDGIYVAQLSENALTATTLAFPAQMVMIAVSVGTGVGVNSLLSRRLGEQRFDEVNSVACHGFMLSLLNGIVFLLFGLFLARPFIRMFSDDAELVRLGSDYLVIVSVFSLGIFLATMGERLLQATGRPTLSMIAQASGAITNIVLDPVFIFGRWGVSAMGIKGAAVATVIGQWVSCLLALGLNAALNHDIKVRFKGFRPNGATIKDIYRVGLPSILMQSIGSITSIGMNKILIASSNAAVSVYGIYFKLQSFVFMPIFGMTQGLVPIVGYNYGARRPKRIKQALRLALIAGVIIMAIGTAVFQLFPEALLSLFEAQGELLALGVRALRIISLILVTAAIGIVMGNVLQGVGNGTVSMVNSFLRQLVCLLPSAYLLNRFLGVEYVWYCFVIAEAVSLLFTLIMFARVWRQKVTPLEREERENTEEEANPTNEESSEIE